MYVKNYSTPALNKQNLCTGHVTIMAPSHTRTHIEESPQPRDPKDPALQVRAARPSEWPAANKTKRRKTQTKRYEHHRDDPGKGPPSVKARPKTSHTALLPTNSLRNSQPDSQPGNQLRSEARSQPASQAAGQEASQRASQLASQSRQLVKQPSSREAKQAARQAARNAASQ